MSKEMQQLKQYFKTETYKSYRALPFWSWNDYLKLDTLEEQMQWMKRSAMGGFFMHARSGLKTKYLSEEWMQCVEYCAEEAEKLGMKAWLYDENGWPSGFAGGKLLEEEGNRDRYILWNIGAFDETATVSYCMNGEALLRVKEGEADKEYLNLYIHTSVSTADILNPDVVKQFLDLTHEQYKARFGDAFSEKIEGFFTDEPQYQRWHTPYTNMMESYFQEEFGEDILDSLGLLFVEKEGYLKFRYRYWKGMQKLMLDGFAKQIYEWCDENGVKLTGHYIEESTLGYQMQCCAGVMPFYEYEHIPGIDWLGKNLSSELCLRQVKSVADQLGKKQVLAEIFACCGWDVKPSELKKVASFQYANGINMICQHLLPYSERGTRKYDHPAHFSEQVTWVKEEFETFTEYFNRLGYLLGEGKEEVRVAMLHPIRSCYFTYKREGKSCWTEWDKALADACRTLSKRGIAYHLLDETLLEKYGFVKEGKIGCGQCAYDYLVLPSIITMDSTTEELVREYVKQGGKVLLLGQRPSYIEAEPYEYSYLETNCTLEDMVEAQPYKITNRDTDIYVTYRTLGDKKFIYAMNASDDKTYTQTFSFDEKIHSFTRVDLTDLSEKQVPLMVELAPGEDALLLLSDKEPAICEKLESYKLRFQDAKVQFEENSLIVDYIRYSTDGKNYSKPWPHLALMNHLIKEHYDGRIYLKYEFCIKDIPRSLKLRAEESKQMGLQVNGIALTSEKKIGWYLNEYDITPYVRTGINECVIETDWHEEDEVYYALFGENVTESLKNCLEYDSELQPIELAGVFGVYPKEAYQEDDNSLYVIGKDFYIGNVPETVTDLTMDGFPFLAGWVTLEQDIQLEQMNVQLVIPGEYQLADVYVNDLRAGRLLFEQELDISHVAKVGKNKVRVSFCISERNLRGPHHMIGRKEENISPLSFGMYEEWKEDKSESYHEDYDLKRFYKKTKK